MKRLLIWISVFIILCLGVIGCSANDPFDDIYTQNIFPSITNTYDIGSALNQYDAGYFREIYLNGVLLVPGGIEVDPVFTGSPAFGITAGDIIGWNALVSSPWVTDVNGITYAGNHVGVNVASGANEMLYLFDNHGGIASQTVLRISENSGSAGAKGIDLSVMGAKTAETYGMYISNAASNLLTPGIHKYGLFIRSVSAWQGVGAINYALYIDTPTGSATADYSIYSAGGLNHLQGALTLGSPLVIGSGGTGQITKIAAFDALSPMSNIGDMIYGGIAGTGTRLAGDNTNTRKFLRTLSVAGVPTAPVWDTIIASDLPSLSGSYVPYTGASSNIDLNTKEVTNGTLNAMVFKGTFTASGVVTFPALTLNGTLNVNDNLVNNIKKINITDPTTLTIASGNITVTQGFHLVDTEGGAPTDDLDTINGGTIGDLLYLSAANDAREINITRTGNIRFQPNHLIESGSFVSPAGSSGTFYSMGFYAAPAAHKVFTQAAPTQTYGTANSAHGAHMFVVSKEAGTKDAGTVSIVVSGTSITSAGVAAADSEVLVANITTMGANTYYQTAKRWLGEVTYTLTLAGGATTATATCNYGKAVCDSLDERKFEIKKFEAFGRAGANDAGFDIQLLHHKATGWTYSAAAFMPGAAALCSLLTEYGAANDLVSGERFTYDRELHVAVDGTANEGFIFRIITTANKAVDFMNASVYVDAIPNDLHLRTTGQAVQLLFNGTNWMEQ